MLAQETIRRKRDGHALSEAEIADFVAGLVTGAWSEGQCAALAMAMLLKGMSQAETVALTQAMMRSGTVMDWSHAQLPGPILDKHSSGGVGDKVSLMLAPIVAACGGFVPMVSGRGLGHTGGTLDKMESIPGYRIAPDAAQLLHTLRTAGCAVVGASAQVAPADRRLYAIRDVTATVESTALITASILSKKLAAGLQVLVMDVKTGNGAFAASIADARTLAQSLVSVAQGAGLPTRAWITDMNQVLGHSCGNALEVLEAVAFLKGEQQEPRLLEVTRTLSAELLQLGGLAPDMDQALQQVDRVLTSGSALERFARMVQALGGPADFCERPAHYLSAAPVLRHTLAPRAGWVHSMATRDIGLLVIELGGGRHQASDTIDARVGLTEVVAVGQKVEPGSVLAVVHAADAASADMAAQSLLKHIAIGDDPVGIQAVMLERLAS
ncbi:thymidine phosphorylase [Rhodoferax lacus]|uniref:Thymidine phosphorylase n=1 Tax=Rhodoferax lacus TaxID=2184758 RepID=A0A3E1RHE7_9BURK|nr:thymidine phosphorylase [Rhodoferax lacus]RFO98816.1 thymidine phosphorylase [Rhodoferax lacus]